MLSASGVPLFLCLKPPSELEIRGFLLPPLLQLLALPPQIADWGGWRAWRLVDRGVRAEAAAKYGHEQASFFCSSPFWKAPL